MVDRRYISENYRVVVFNLVLLESVHFEPFSKQLFPIIEETEHFLSKGVAVIEILEHDKNWLFSFELDQSNVFMSDFVMVDINETFGHLFHIDFISSHFY